MTAALVSVTGEGKIGTAFKRVEEVRLRPDPYRFDDPDNLDAFLATANQRLLGRHARAVIDYVRLEIDAVRR